MPGHLVPPPVRQVVAFTANDRLDCMRQALESWSKVRGVGNAMLLFRVEPGNQEMLRLCGEASDFAGEVMVFENAEKYGELGNPWHAIDTAFTFGDFVILAEDDDLVSTDVLEYFAWCRDYYAGHTNILTVNAFRHHGGEVPDDAVQQTAGFTSWIWGTWQDRWHGLLRNDWDFDYRHRGWDWRIIDHWLGSMGYKTVQPGASRSQHIGVDGVHFRSERGDFERLRSTCFTEDRPPVTYKEAT